MKKVTVKTSCGDTHHIHVDQDVESVEVDGVTYVRKEEEKKKVTDFRYGLSTLLWVSREGKKNGFYFEPDGFGHYDLKKPNEDAIAHFYSSGLDNVEPISS